MKYAYDEKGISFSLFLSSSRILLRKKIRESLAGRAALYELWPLLMREVHGEDSETAIAPPLLDKEDARARAAEDYPLRWGGSYSPIILISARFLRLPSNSA